VLSEYHPLSETLARLVSKVNLEENLSRKHMLNVSPARLESHLFLMALSTPGSLSQSSLTCTKRENGAKRAFEDRKPFLKLEVKEKRELGG